MGGSNSPRSRGHSPQPWWRSRWRQVTAAVLTVGALAGAVGSVKALWPSDVEDRAAFTSVNARAPIRLSEYRARLTLQRQQDSKNSLESKNSLRAPDAALVVPTVMTAATPTPTTEPSPTRTGPVVETSSASPTTSDGAEVLTDPSLLADKVPKLFEAVNGRAAARLPQYVIPASVAPQKDPTHVVTLPIVVQAATDDKGHTVPPDVAAERVATLFRSARSAPLHGKREPVGALVSANLDLDGLKNTWVSLSWSMYPEGETEPLFGEWLRTTAAFKLKPSTDHDTAAASLWVPLPKKKGNYVVTLTLSLRGIPLTSADSPVVN
jgi:hypothetical protein